jgi:hypothetical protein
MELDDISVAGAAMGTAAYMSPEQARGEKLDARTDLFSFGAVLYEMATGRQAFSGETSGEIREAILTRQATPPLSLKPDLPPKLVEIILKALEKDRDLRYQGASEIRTDLKRLKRDTDSEHASVGAGLVPGQRGRPRGAPLRKRWAAIAAGIVLIGIALGVVGSHWYRRPRATPEAPLTAVPLTTYLGNESYPSFSPDGSQVAFTWNGQKQDNFDIYVKLVGADPPLRLTTNPAVDTSPAWSQDGRGIAFDRLSPGSKVAVVLISPLGGPERILTEMYLSYADTNADGPFLAWSPDSQWLALVGADKPNEFAGLFLYSVETGEKRRLTSPSSPGLQEDTTLQLAENERVDAGNAPFLENFKSPTTQRVEGMRDFCPSQRRVGHKCSLL